MVVVFDHVIVSRLEPALHPTMASFYVPAFVVSSSVPDAPSLICLTPPPPTFMDFKGFCRSGAYLLKVGFEKQAACLQVKGLAVWGKGGADLGGRGEGRGAGGDDNLAGDTYL